MLNPPSHHQEFKGFELNCDISNTKAKEIPQYDTKPSIWTRKKLWQGCMTDLHNIASDWANSNSNSNSLLYQQPPTPKGGVIMTENDR